jgi:predicted transglutaminase-like cysteine proteinase
MNGSAKSASAQGSALVDWLVVFLLCLSVLYAEPFVGTTLLEKVKKQYGEFALNRFLRLNEVLKKAEGENERRRLEIVNDFFNEVRYSPDEKTYNKKDYWATPWEFLARDRGDCEDYVIAKYFALRQLGIASEKLYFTYVRSSRFKEPHMVLTYFETPGSVPLVLDNTNYKILPATMRDDLVPVYNFNGDVLYLSETKGYGKKAKSDKAREKWEILMHNIKSRFIKNNLNS